MDAKGYCVNIPWKNGGVGDNDYIFAFKNAVLPIGTLNFFLQFLWTSHEEKFLLYSVPKIRGKLIIFSLMTWMDEWMFSTELSKLLNQNKITIRVSRN